MFEIARREMALPPLSAANGITIGTLLAACDAQPGAELVFSHGGRAQSAGYRMSDVRTAAFSSLDGEGNAESWTEVVIQIVATLEADRPGIAAETFAAIIRKVVDPTGDASSAKATIEIGDETAPIEVYCAGFPEATNGLLLVPLIPRRASTKPLERWLNIVRPGCTCCVAGSGVFTCG